MVSVHTAVLDAIEDWEEVFPRQYEVYRKDDPPPGMDTMKTWVLRELRIRLCVTFEKWVMEEVLLFVLRAYKREELMDVTKEGVFSLFLDEVYDMWEPSCYDWVNFLWNICGRACELFADVLYVFRQQASVEGRFAMPTLPALGRVLLRDMMVRGVLHERTGASIVGALVYYPNEGTLARLHARDIMELAKELTPIETGFVVRSVLMFRAKEGCNCGYKVGEDVCDCASRYIMNRYRGPKGVVLDGDLNKEYANAICKLILEQHDESSLQISKVRLRKKQWSEQEVGEFIRSVCEVVFSEGVYVELFENLQGGRQPELKLERPRQLSEAEKRNNVVRNIDGDYNHGVAQHGGCVDRGCKQALKVGCENMSCNTHCHKKGRVDCQPHRNYDSLGWPSYPQRKHVALRGGGG